MALKELYSNVNAALVDQELNDECDLLVNNFKLSLDDRNCLQERNKQLCADIMILKSKLFSLKIRCNNVANENK